MMMDLEKETTILVIEDNIADFILLQEYLNLTTTTGDYKILHSKNLNEALSYEGVENPDVILLDLNLPDSHGLETFLTVNALFPVSSILILSGVDDKEISLHAIHAGAQDFILKGDFDERLLEKTIKYSIERKKSQLELQESNSRFEMVSKATSDPIWDWDLLTNEIKWNDKVSIFGYPQIVNKNEAWRYSCIHPEDRERVSQNLERYIKDGNETWSEQYRFHCFDETYRHVLDRGYIMRSRSGVAYRMIGSMENITAMVELQNKFEQERKERQTEILKAIITGQEKEKNEIGGELHDNINQLLAAVKMYLGIAKNDEKLSKEMVLKSYGYVEDVMEEIRKLSHSLVAPSLGNISLQEALKDLADEINSGKKIQIKYIDITRELIIDKEKALTLYRIAQEQMSNIVKHSQANSVILKLETTKEQYCLTIKDDGIGFDKTAHLHGLGFKNILHRIGLFEGNMNIDSAPGLGCTITISIPQ